MKDLTDLQVKNLKKLGATRVTRNLYVILSSSNTKTWKYRRYFNSKQVEISFGKYPSISLREAKQRTDEANSYFDNGQDYREVLQKNKLEQNTQSTNTFKQIAEKWFERKESSDKTLQGISSRLRTYIYPALGHLPITEIKRKHITDLMLQIENQGKIEMANRVKGIVSQVFDHAITLDLVEYNPTYGLKNFSRKGYVKHMPTIIEPKEISKLLNDIDGYKGAITTCIALKIAPHVFFTSKRNTQSKMVVYRL